jgi:ribose transport system permease protein
MDELSTPEPAASEAPALRRRPFRLPEEIGVIVALLVMIAVIGIARPRFLNPINLLTILGNTTFQGMLSLGMVFLLAIREIDLSVGWMFNFSAVVAALMMVGGVNPWLAALAGIGFGSVLGLVNGVLAIGLRLPSIIVTLGTYSMFEGLSLVANQGRAVFPTDQSVGARSSAPSSAC